MLSLVVDIYNYAFNTHVCKMQDTRKFKKVIPKKPKKVIVKKNGKKVTQKCKDVLYAFECTSGTNTLFKVGKTINLKQRIRSYNTLYPDGKVIFSIECKNIHYSERFLHDSLKMNGFHVKQEIFNIDRKLLIEYMKFAAKLNKLLFECNTKNIDQVDQEICKINSKI